MKPSRPSPKSGDSLSKEPLPENVARAVSKVLGSGYISQRMDPRYGRARKWQCESERSRTKLLVKELVGVAKREGLIYRLVLPHSKVRRPALLFESGETETRQGAWIGIEWIDGHQVEFPRQLGLIMRQLTILHQSKEAFQCMLKTRMSETVKSRLRSRIESATRSLERIAQRSNFGRASHVARSLLALPAWEGEVEWVAAFSPTLVHGNLHSGNVIIKVQDGSPGAVLIDWADANVGSIIEDLGNLLCEWPGACDLIVEAYNTALVRTGSQVTVSNVRRGARLYAFLNAGWFASGLRSLDEPAFGRLLQMGNFLGI